MIAVTLGGWAEYGAAWGAFLLTHALPVRPPLRPWLVGRLGRAGFGIAYSALSLAVLVWLFGAAARAPFIPLWHMPAWGPWIVLAAMALAAVVLATELGRPNPLSIGGGDGPLDPARPGLLRLTRHPVLAALALWAGAHLVVNGDLAHALMFGGFLFLALAGMGMIDRRRRRSLGADQWARMTAAAARSPLGGPSPGRLLVGLAVLGALVALHPWIAGPGVAAFFLP